MTLWLTLTILTAVAAVAIAIPFARRIRPPVGDTAREIDLARRQLSEIGREAAAGALSETEAQFARTEIEHRILALAKEEPRVAHPHSQNARNLTVAIVTGWLVVGAAGLYASTGRPDLRASPFQDQPISRAAAPVPSASPSATAATANVEDAIAGLAVRLSDNPADADGWRMLGWSYFNTERYAEAATAYAKAVALRSDDAELLSLFGETLVRAADGLVTDEALAVFGRAVSLDPADARARFFQGMALEQSGDAAGAIDAWSALLATATPGAEWTAGVERRIRELAAASEIELRGQVPALNSATDGLLPPRTRSGPTEEEVAAATDMSPEDRQAMIRGMVEGLQNRLDGEPRDAEGWIKLMRSRLVLGEPDLARRALGRATETFADEPETRARIIAAAGDLGLQPD